MRALSGRVVVPAGPGCRALSDRAACCARGRRPAREPSEPRASLGASARCPARPCHRPRALQPGLPDPPAPSTPVGPGVLARGSARRLVACLVPAACHRGLPRRHSNFACNSLATISNNEFTAVELQRFHTLLNLRRIELHAELMEPDPTTAASFESGTLRRCSRF